MKKLFRIFPIAVIIALCAIFFYPTFTKGLLPVPTDTLIGLYHPWLDQAATTNPAGVPFKNFLITDPIRQLIPWRKLVIDDLKKGYLPLWNPYNFSGTPLMANIQAAAWYPLNILFFIFPFFIAWTMLIMVQPLLAATFLYVYLRSKKVLPLIAVFAGLTWAFCGFSVAWLTWGTIVQTALWLPLLLLAVDHIFEESKKRQIVVWGAVFSVSASCALFAGHAQVALYIFAFAGVYGLFGLWNTTHKKNVLWLAAAILVAVLISSVQWIPLIQLIGHSSRIADTTAWLKDGWFLPWQNLSQFIAPDFFGNPATLNYWGIWNYGEFIGYVGILPLIFSMYAVITRKDRLTRFIELMLLAVFLCLLPTPLAKLPFQLHIPILFSLQPTRLMILVDFCLVLLAALGLDSYLKVSSKRILIPILFIGLALVSLWIYVIRTVHLTTDTTLISNLDVSRRNLTLPSIMVFVSGGLILAPLLFKKLKWATFVFLVIFVTVFDLFRFGWKFTPFTPAEYFFPTTQAISFLQNQQKPFRVMSLDNRILPPNVGAYYGVESIEGYDPIYDARYEEFIAALNRDKPNIMPPFGFNRIITSPTVDSPLLPILNVKYVMALEDVKNPALRLVYQEGSTRIYNYTKALPRIYPVSSVKYATSKQQAISILYDKSFNPESAAVVENSLTVPVHPKSADDTIRITSYLNSSLTAVSTLKESHFVVVSDMYSPNWKVTIDSTVVQTYRTDCVCIGFIVPGGVHTIKLTYE